MAAAEHARRALGRSRSVTSAEALSTDGAAAAAAAATSEGSDAGKKRRQFPAAGHGSFVNLQARGGHMGAPGELPTHSRRSSISMESRQDSLVTGALPGGQGLPLGRGGWAEGAAPKEEASHAVAQEVMRDRMASVGVCEGEGKGAACVNVCSTGTSKEVQTNLATASLSGHPPSLNPCSRPVPRHGCGACLPCPPGSQASEGIPPVMPAPLRSLCGTQLASSAATAVWH